MNREGSFQLVYDIPNVSRGAEKGTFYGINTSVNIKLENFYAYLTEANG